MKFLGKLLAIAFPWLIFLMEDNLMMALVALILQASVIGWIPIICVAWQHTDNIPAFSGQDKHKTKES